MENGRRQQLKEQNRVTLIEATLDSIAEIGFARTSVSEIIDRANLSRGMIHLHFGGKDALVEEAAKYSSADYYDSLDGLLQTAGPEPQERIEAIIRSDLSERVLNKRTVSLWYAFRGESRERETIAAYSDTRDARLRNLAFDAFLKIARQTDLPDPETTAKDATHGLLALLEGMWTDFLLHPESFDRDTAMRTIFRFLSALFPSFFALQGAVRRDREHR
ncbi:TetR family transcriptional regulator C-terminal domain-containing protein [Hoeflea sp. TYP-13]|uniref:TetR family transcriptional regulator C-terminal domain-containing protein n=1 Tax=Hoeflea sp. TYP-13 TaxID=3230023 RepID=UPI0034C5F8DB